MISMIWLVEEMGQEKKMYLEKLNISKKYPIKVHGWSIGILQDYHCWYLYFSRFDYDFGEYNRIFQDNTKYTYIKIMINVERINIVSSTSSKVSTNQTFIKPQAQQ